MKLPAGKGPSWVERRAAINRQAGLPTSAALVDKTVEQGFVNQSAVFEVPSSIFPERVKRDENKWQRKFCHALEKGGFQILAVSPAFLDDRPGCPPDRVRYRIIARCRRRPSKLVMDVPDILVPNLLASGYQLT